uniref:Uncharacterized protein n=1 Tax=Noccaea caerulescens TaxID=107243 RepID=A0A1J3ESI1_NOCCA
MAQLQAVNVTKKPLKSFLFHHFMKMMQRIASSQSHGMLEHFDASNRGLYMRVAQNHPKALHLTFTELLKLFAHVFLISLKRL